MSNNNFISAQEAQSNAQRERFAKASKHRSGGTLRVFDRFFKKQESAEQQIARLQKEVAADRAAAESLSQAHARLVAKVNEARTSIANAQERIVILNEKRVSPAGFLYNKVTSTNQANVGVINASREVAEIDTAIIHCRDILKDLLAELPAHESALADFERKYAEDLAPVEAEFAT
jgi:hypothetical protein